MDELFSQLEASIRSLLGKYEQQKDSNIKLRQTKAELLQEKESLLNKQKNAISQIENMVARLKSIEKPL